MRRLCLLTVLTALCAAAYSAPAVGQFVADAQPKPRGEWTGFVTPPGGVPYKAVYTVADRGDSLRLRMTVPEWGADFPLHNVTHEGRTIRFWWAPRERVDCQLLRDEEGVFRGECWDDAGSVAPMVMAAPGVSVDDEIDAQRAAAEEAKRRNEKWALRRELDQIDGPRGDMVDIGGTVLNALIAGGGPATVVLLSDVGDDLRTWDYVVLDVQDFARVLAYSREGTGYSTAGSLDVSVQCAVDNLRRLLDVSKLGSPYVLVGHGFGGVLAQAFATSYPQETGGVVLVDPLHPELARRLEELDGASWNAYWEGQRTLYDMVDGRVRDEFALHQRWVEGRKVPSVGELPNVPVVVVSGLRAPESARWVGEQAEGLAARKTVHEALAATNGEGTHRETTKSGHYIQREDPDLLIDVIHELVNDASPGTTPKSINTYESR